MLNEQQLQLIAQEPLEEKKATDIAINQKSVSFIPFIDFFALKPSDSNLAEE